MLKESNINFKSNYGFKVFHFESYIYISIFLKGLSFIFIGMVIYILLFRYNYGTPKIIWYLD